jgi:large subunit ribosomal protein L22
MAKESRHNTAYLHGVRIAPRKARLVVDLIRDKPVQEALDILKLTNKKAAPILSKLIRSAISNSLTRHDGNLDVDMLIVEEAYVNEGPTLKRFLPRAQGRATPIRKRTSHITVKINHLVEDL